MGGCGTQEGSERSMVYPMIVPIPLKDLAAAVSPIYQPAGGLH